MSDGSLTYEMLQRFIEQSHARMREGPVLTPVVFCHPKELYWHELMYGTPGLRTRLRAFRAFWRFRKMFNDDQIMVALSRILTGSVI